MSALVLVHVLRFVDRPQVIGDRGLAGAGLAALVRQGLSALLTLGLVPAVQRGHGELVLVYRSPHAHKPLVDLPGVARTLVGFPVLPPGGQDPLLVTDVFPFFVGQAGQVVIHRRRLRFGAPVHGLRLGRQAGKRDKQHPPGSAAALAGLVFNRAVKCR